MPTTLTYRFSQREYRLRLGINDLDGLCISLVGKWCYLILSDAKDRWENPKSSAEDRFAVFSTKETYQTIAQEQRISNARLGRLRTANQGLEKLLDIAKIMKNSGYLTERQPLVDAALQIGPEVIQRGDKIPREVLSKFGCTTVSEPVTVAWSSIAETLLAKHCYAITFVTKPAGQHAIGAYISDGFFNNDHHIFDPNFGEYKATTTADTKKFLNVLAAEYGTPLEARIFEMKL